MQVVSEFRAVLGLAAGETVFLHPCVAHVHDVGHDAGKRVAVLDHAGQRRAPDIDAVIGALARHEAGAMAFAPCAVVGHRDLQRRVDGLRAGIGEEDVIDVLRQQSGQFAGKLEAPRVTELEWRRVVILQQLPVHRFGDFLAAMTGRHVEQA